MSTEREELLGDRYALAEVIGRGGMADVYRATDQLLSREVAAKVLRDRADDDSDRDRFTGEARTLAGLSHPGLVMILDAGIDAERPYLVMELVEGSTLAAPFANGPMDPLEAARIGAQVAAALAYVHKQGVIHRDVKPGNVLLGTDGRVKLADFGIARLIGDTMRHTRTGQAIGTPAYLAPEQVRGAEITPASDVYALGLLLIEALSGTRAYPGAPVEAAMARLTAPPPIPDGLPGSWRSLLTDATATDPAHRPDAATLAERLLVLTSATPMMAPAPTMTMAMPMSMPVAADRRWADWLRARPSEQRWVAAAIAAMAILVVIAGFAADGDTTPTAAADASQAPSSTPRSQTSKPPPSSPSAPQTTDAARQAQAEKGSSAPQKGQQDDKKDGKKGKKRGPKHQR